MVERIHLIGKHDVRILIQRTERGRATLVSVLWGAVLIIEMNFCAVGCFLPEAGKVKSFCSLCPGVAEPQSILGTGATQFATCSYHRGIEVKLVQIRRTYSHV